MSWMSWTNTYIMVRPNLLIQQMFDVDHSICYNTKIFWTLYIYIELSLDALSVTYPVLFVLLPLIHRTFLSPILPSPILSSPILSSYAILSSPILPSYPLILFRPSIPSSSPALSYPLLSYPPITLYDVINRQTSLGE